MGFTLVEKKIFICSLGIVLITLICYIFFTNFNRISEPLAPFKIPVVDDIVGIANFLTKMAMDIAKNIRDKLTDIKNNLLADARTASTNLKVKLSELKLQATANRNQAVSTADRQAKSVAEKLRDAAYAVKNRASQIAIAAQNRAYQVASAAKDQAVKAKDVRHVFRFFRKYWKYFLVVILFFSKIGQWCVKNIQTLIYRIASFKNCFLWYFLEIIGWVIYIPIEFFVWLFCLKDLENMVWDLLKKLDCTFNDITGFHFMFYSDDVNKKCFSRKFLPFPKPNFSTDNLGESIGKFILEFLLPVSPDELKEIGNIGKKKSQEHSEELNNSV